MTKKEEKKKNKYFRYDSEGNRWFKVPLQKRIRLFFKKGILVGKEVISLEEADKDFNYNKVTRLCLFNKEIVTRVHAKGPDYVIHDRLDSNIVVSATPELEKKLNDIGFSLVTMGVQLSAREQRRFSNRLSTAIRMALFGVKTKPQLIVKEVSQSVLLMRKNKFRLLYLLGASTVAFLLGILITGYQIYDWSFGTDWNETKFLNILLFSSIGGIFSVLLGYRSIKGDIPEARWFSYFINGVSRIIISLLAGIVAYEFMMGEFIFANLNDQPYALYCLSILAGFAETFIPGVLKKTTKELKEDPD